MIFLTIGSPLGTFIPGRLGTSLAACRDSNKHGGPCDKNGERELLKGNRSSFIVCPVTLRLKLPTLEFFERRVLTGILAIFARNIGAVDIERTRVLIFLDVPVPASQLVALQKKLEQAKAQLERKVTKPAKQKVSSLERKLFLASDVPSFLDLEKYKLQQKEIFRLLKGHYTLMKRMSTDCNHCEEFCWFIYRSHPSTFTIGIDDNITVRLHTIPENIELFNR